MTVGLRDEETLPPRVAGALIGRPARVVTTVTDVGGASTQGTARPRNEDAWGHRLGAAFALADGMGGRPDGATAANASVDALLDALAADSIDWAGVAARANTAVNAATSGGGSVVVALRVGAEGTSVFHLGDARAYRLRNGLSEPLTRDHTVAEMMADAGIRRRDSGLRERELAAVTGWLGDDTTWFGFDVCELTVLAGDRIVLCSDGVHRHVSPTGWSLSAEIGGAGDAAEFLVETARRAGSTDDSTAVVIDLDLAPRTAAET